LAERKYNKLSNMTEPKKTCENTKTYCKRLILNNCKKRQHPCKNHLPTKLGTNLCSY